MLRERLIDSGWEWADDAKTTALFAGLVERGRFFGTEATLAATVGLTARQVRRSLDRLRQKYIETRRRSRGLVITVKRSVYWQKMAIAAVKSGQSEPVKSGQTATLKNGQKVVNHGSINGQPLNTDSLTNNLSLKYLNNPPLPPATENLVNHDLVNHDSMSEAEAWAKIETAIAAIGEALTAIRALRQRPPTQAVGEQPTAAAQSTKERLSAVEERPPRFRRQKEKSTESVADFGGDEKTNHALPPHLRAAISGIAKRMSLPVTDAVLDRVVQQTPEFIGNWLDAEKDRQRGAKIGVPLAVAEWRVAHGVSPRAETLREVKQAFAPPPILAPPKPIPNRNCVYCEGTGKIVPEMLCECVGGEHRELAEVRKLQAEHIKFLNETSQKMRELLRRPPRVTESPPPAFNRNFRRVDSVENLMACSLN